MPSRAVTVDGRMARKRTKKRALMIMAGGCLHGRAPYAAVAALWERVDGVLTLGSGGSRVLLLFETLIIEQAIYIGGLD